MNNKVVYVVGPVYWDAFMPTSAYLDLSKALNDGVDAVTAAGYDVVQLIIMGLDGYRPTMGDLLLAEYEARKEEQKRKIKIYVRRA